MTFNKVLLLGRLTKTPELRYTLKGHPVAKFNLAVQHYNNKNEADFIPVVAYNRLAETVVDHLTKGSLVLVDGWLKCRRWLDESQNHRMAMEVVAQQVVFIGRPSNRDQQASGKPKPESNPEFVSPTEEIPEHDEPPF